MKRTTTPEPSTSPTSRDPAPRRAWVWGEVAPCLVCGSGTQARMYLDEVRLEPVCETHTAAEVSAMER